MSVLLKNWFSFEGREILVQVLSARTIPATDMWPEPSKNTKPRRTQRIRHGLVRIAGLALRVYGRRIKMKGQTRRLPGLNLQMKRWILTQRNGIW